MANNKIEKLLEEAAIKKASDLHLKVGQPPILRIDGVLKPIEKEVSLTSKDVLDLICSITEKHQQDKYIKNKELDFSYEIKDIARYRINAHWESGNPSLVARVIGIDVPTMEEIMMPEVVYDLMNSKQGLILVTGPTGSGKSTSLAAMIDYVNKNRNLHIVTLEDPVEFVYQQNKSLIRQRELGTDFLSFAEGLKRVVRQDPDVILVGEMRDLETIAAALTLAETGHLVLATLHTNSTAQTIDRVIDVFPPHQQTQIRLQLSMVLLSVVAQQLLPKVDQGRVAAREILINTPAVSNLIRENKIPQINSVIQTSKKDGMIAMDQNLSFLHKEGFITKEVAQAYATRRGAIK